MKKIAIAIIASLAVFGASVSVATPASAAKSSYTKKENKLWKGMKQIQPQNTKKVTKRTVVDYGNAACELFDVAGVPLGFDILSNQIAETSIGMPSREQDQFIKLSVGIVVASTYTICTEHQEDLDLVIDQL